MKIKYLLAASVVSLSAAATLSAPAYAQQITSGIEGQVTTDAGEPIPGATATITDTRTNSVRTATADSEGNFRVQSLPPGGPYTVTITAPGYEGQTVEDVFADLGRRQSFSFTLTSTAAGASDEVIVVTGARARASQVAVGPGTAFGTETLENFPSITRDIRDIIRIDPRVSLDRDNEVDRISCIGGNDRSNTFTVDGIVQSDTFGLNGTPFAARNSLPLPFDVVDQTSVEFAPFDVEYSEFTGCLVNVVTKAGTNRFSGSAFFTYFDAGLQNDEIDGQPFNAGEEQRWGATLSGPIIKDRLFFSFGYEEADLAEGNNLGTADSTAGNTRDFVTTEQFNEFDRIARDVYGQDTGGIQSTLPEGNVRYFGRLDALITEDHRLEGTYQRLEETNVEFDGGGDNFTGYNSFEDEGTISDYYSVRLYSNWSDVLSTELRVSRAEVGDVQGPVGAGEAQSDDPTVRLEVGVENVTGPGEDGILGTADDEIEQGTLSTGPGIFRSANQLDQKIDQARFQMNYDAGNGHNLKFGFEVNDLEVFNLFAVNATGTIFFESLEDFEAGIAAGGTDDSGDPNDILSGNNVGADINVAVDNDINNAAAEFGRQIYSVYAQDEWQATDQLAVNMGVRVQLYDGDAPQANQNFIDRYGFTNAVSFGTLDPLILPRVSATYEFDNEGFFSNSRITGGVGVFSGGDPVVWYSNAFSNNGFTTGRATSNECSDAELGRDANGQFSVLENGQFTGVPQCVVNAGEAEASAGLADVQSIDPNLDLPSVVRANVGFNTTVGSETGFFSDWNLQLDYIYSRFNDTLQWVDLSQAVNPSLGLDGFTVDGRPIYRAVDVTRAGCDAQLVGTGGVGPEYTGLTDECFGTFRDDNIQLTNGPSTESHALSFILSKRFDSGLFTDNGSTNFTLGYSFTNAENARDAASSTATSSFDGVAYFDIQDPAIATSNFETQHNITASLFLREEFFEGYSTGLGIFFNARSGRPYSLTFDGGGEFADSASGSDNALLYIPTGVNDPNLTDYSGLGFSAAQQAALQAEQASAVTGLLNYLENDEGAASCDFELGETIERNTCRNDWFFDVDFRISQEIPFIGNLTGIADDRIEFFADFSNFLNLLDSSWNVLRQRNSRVDLVDAGIEIDDPEDLVPDADGDFDQISAGAVDSQGRYSISNFAPDDDNDVTQSASAWRIQIGVRYEF
ncbi:MAG: TonB-dependent receptor [Erythrobacter sp.]|uniref:TonB-dependent receptor n=1 Tax=Erythrobacter sp. TaxID=1042 RepID=UPI00262DDDF8|nr:carboxypeptidase regulatory-like domain-containing protein [Erythrobacter sp.]MDJ0979055.1 TonB-dependent receptor [Erythrobacter sp.]